MRHPTCRHIRLEILLLVLVLMVTTPCVAADEGEAQKDSVLETAELTTGQVFLFGREVNEDGAPPRIERTMHSILINGNQVVTPPFINRFPQGQIPVDLREKYSLGQRAMNVFSGREAPHLSHGERLDSLRSIIGSHPEAFDSADVSTDGTTLRLWYSGEDATVFYSTGDAVGPTSESERLALEFTSIRHALERGMIVIYQANGAKTIVPRSLRAEALAEIEHARAASREAVTPEHWTGKMISASAAAEFQSPPDLPPDH